MAKKVELLIPKIPGTKAEDVLIFINGKCTQIPRGKRVKVDEAVAKEYERSLKAQERFDASSEARLYKDPAEAKQTAAQAVSGVVD